MLRHTSLSYVLVDNKLLNQSCENKAPNAQSLSDYINSVATREWKNYYLISAGLSNSISAKNTVTITGVSV